MILRFTSYPCLSLSIWVSFCYWNHYNGKTKKTPGDRAFAMAAPRLFNSLPREIRHETCFNTLKTKVKTFLFCTAFC